MNKSEIIDKLISQMSTLNGWFIGYTGTLVAIVIFVCGFIVFSQKSELRKMRKELDRKLIELDQKERNIDNDLDTISKSVYILAAGRTFPQGIPNWKLTRNIFLVAKKRLNDNREYYLKRLRNAVVIEYYQGLENKGIDYKSLKNLFISKSIDGYDTFTNIDFNGLANVISEVKHGEDQIELFNELHSFKEFWEQTK